MRVTIIPTAIIALAAVIGLPLTAEAAGDPAAANCSQGTGIVGTPGGTVTGTDGPEIITTNGAAVVSAGGGDDCVYVTEAGPDRVDLGEGDDIVRHENPESDANLNGSTYEGGPGIDRLDTIAWDLGLDPTTGTLVVTVPAGGSATAAVPGFEGAQLAAVFVDVRGTTGPNDLSAYGCQVVVRGGGGDDLLSDRSWFDNDPHTACEEGLGTVQPRGTKLHGGGGDDELRGESMFQDFRFAGGGGRDRFVIEDPRLGSYQGALDVELNGRVRFGKGKYSSGGSLRSVEDATITADYTSVRVTGTGAANDVSAAARCRVVLTGLGGDDRLDLDERHVVGYDHDCPNRAFQAFGGQGNDHLNGSEKGDLLTGGSGRDKASGRKGKDTCEAEVRRTCER